MRKSEKKCSWSENTGLLFNKTIIRLLFSFENPYSELSH